MKYIIVATIESIEKESFSIKGVSPYLFQNSKKEQWNIFEPIVDPKDEKEGKNAMKNEDPILRSVATSRISNDQTGLAQQIIAETFGNRKSLKITVNVIGGQLSLFSISHNEN